MASEIKVPTLGESVSSATIARWLKKVGEAVAADEPLVELETDKVTVEVPSPVAGTMGEQVVAEGDEVEVGATLGLIEEGVGAAPKASDGTPASGGAPAKPVAEAGAPATRQTAPAGQTPQPTQREAANPGSGVNPPPRPGGPVSRPATPPSDVAANSALDVQPQGAGHAPMPSAARMMSERQVEPGQVDGTGRDGRITKGDVIDFLSRPAPAKPAAAAPKAPREPDVREERVKMTRLRKTIANRLKEAQNTAAMLTTFNEVDMSAAMALRSEYREAFEKKHGGVRLGFMGFFVRACVAALQEFPAVNAEIDGDEIVYKKFVHMGIAVGGANGLVVPVIRDADAMSLAQIEAAVGSFGKRARDGSLKLDELAGGTFSITNGGVYGSLMSTPILNPPQSAILGMHKIQERPIAVKGQVVIRPMMYLALSYDHRIVDGKEAVSFLVRVKEGVEDPRRLLLGL
ncbi:MAG: 2-oxoglutarate dehydrogenase complex dihydrolipoyllysine-residue succinyltransferase [Janthinobacterium lividum]